MASFSIPSGNMSISETGNGINVSVSNSFSIPHESKLDFIKYLKDIVDSLEQSTTPEQSTKIIPPLLPELNPNKVLVGPDGRLYKSDSVEWVQIMDNRESNIKLTELVDSKKNKEKQISSQNLLGYPDKYYDIDIGIDGVSIYKVFVVLVLLRQRNDLPAPNDWLKLGIHKNITFPDIHIDFDGNLVDYLLSYGSDSNPKIKLPFKNIVLNAGVMLYVIMAFGIINTLDLQNILSLLTPDMEKLPNEIIEEICNHLDAKNLSAFVRSNKRIHDVCQRSMAKKKREKEENYKYEAIFYRYGWNGYYKIGEDYDPRPADAQEIGRLKFNPQSDRRTDRYYYVYSADAGRGGRTHPISPFFNSQAALKRWVKENHYKLGTDSYYDYVKMLL